MLIVALVLAVIGLAALVTAVVTSNELIAWVCIAASVIGVVLLIVDAVRERSRRRRPPKTTRTTRREFDEDYPEEASGTQTTPKTKPRPRSSSRPTMSPARTATAKPLELRAIRALRRR